MMKWSLVLAMTLLAFAAIAIAQTPADEAQALLQAEDFDAAIEVLRKAVKEDESNSRNRSLLGRAYIGKLQSASFFEKGMLAGRAQEQLKTAIELDPTNIEARIYLASYYLNAPSIGGGSVKKAREQAEIIVEYAPLQGKSLLARIHEREENFDEAMALYRECIESEPADLQMRYRVAMLQQKLERFEEAFATLEALLEISPDATAALYQMGRTAVFAGKNLDRGIECLREYLEHEVEAGRPGHDAAHWRMGMLYELRGDLSKAREAFETAIGLNGTEEKYRESLAALDQG